MFIEPCCNASHMPVDCEGVLDRCTYSCLPGPRKYAIQRFVEELKDGLALVEENETLRKDILNRLGKHFKENGIPKHPIPKEDYLKLSGRSYVWEGAYDALRPAYSDNFASITKAACVANRVEDLLNEWIPVFRHFEPKP